MLNSPPFSKKNSTVHLFSATALNSLPMAGKSPILNHYTVNTAFPLNAYNQARK